MSLLSILTALNTPEGLTPDAKKAPGERQSGDASFMQVLDQALQAGYDQELTPAPQAAPLPAVLPQPETVQEVASELPPAETLSAELPQPPESKADITPESTLTPPKPPAFPLNIISSLQALFQPQTAEKPLPVAESVEIEVAVPEVVPSTVPVIEPEAPFPVQDVTPHVTPVRTAVVMQTEPASTEGMASQTLPVELNDAENEILPASLLKTPVEKKSIQKQPEEALTERSQAPAPVATSAELLAMLPLAMPELNNQLQTVKPLPDTTETLPKVQVAQAPLTAVTPSSPASISTATPDAPIAQPTGNAPSFASAMQSVDVPDKALPTEEMITPAYAMKDDDTTEGLEPRKEHRFAESMPETTQKLDKVSGNKPDKRQTDPIFSENTSSVQALHDIESKLSALNGQVESLSVEMETAFPEAHTEATSIETSAPAPVKLDSEPVASSKFQPEPAKLPTFMPKAAHPAEQVVEGTVYSVKNGHQELVIRLNPENLGEVRVNLSTSGKDGLSARLIASSAESHEALQTHLSQLKTSLEAQGVQLERLSVVVAGNTESGNPTGQQGQQQTFQQQDSQQARMASHDFNQQQHNQSNGQPAFHFEQHGGQAFKSPYAQSFPSASHWQEVTGSEEPAQRPRQNDNGSISLLA